MLSLANIAAWCLHLPKSETWKSMTWPDFLVAFTLTVYIYTDDLSSWFKYSFLGLLYINLLGP